jgi:inner membrane protein
MRAPNHIAGGFVFTGIFASLWNINVFGSVSLFLVTALASLLPDIDHTKSILGKLFYPLAKYIDRKYGHRTVTHSLLFLTCIIAASIYIEKMFSDDFSYSIVIFFAVLSHYILDMATVQGIPLFFPFAKNPCVIPGNPAYRIRSSNKQAELVAFSIFILIGLSCVNLFQNGFWTSYNRAFGTIKHLHRENRASNNLIQVDYDYFRNSKQYKGSGILVDSKYEVAVLFDKEIITLSETDLSTKVVSVIPSRLPVLKEIRELTFFNITLDSLSKLCSHQIVSGQIQSSEPVEYFENNIKRRSSLMKFEHIYNFSVAIIPDSLQAKLTNQLKIKELTLNRTKSDYNLKLRELSQIRAKYDENFLSMLQAKDLYQKNKLQAELIKLRTQISNYESKVDSFRPDPVLLYEIQSLKTEVNQARTITFSGMINYFVVPEMLAMNKVNEEVE